MKSIRYATLTIFDTPLLNTALRTLSRFYLKAAGWRLTGDRPLHRRYVVIGAPHTSNWDLPMMLAIVFTFRLKVYFLAKDSLFSPPFGIILRWLGGIAVKRDSANDLVNQAIDLFSTQRDFILVVPPEGTRQQVRYWKSGFYYIAHGAQVPIVLGFVDFKHKTAGFGGTFVPCGDFAADLVKIQEFYAGITGKNPELTSKLTVKETEARP